MIHSKSPIIALMRFLPFTKYGNPIHAIVIAGLAISIVLSASHHLFNFWGLVWGIQALIFVPFVPIIFLILSFLYSQIKDACTRIEKRRWVIFALPAIVVVAALAWTLYSSPVVWHALEIIPPKAEPGLIQLIQIRAGGKVIKLSEIESSGGWVEQDGRLTNNGRTSNPLEVHFRAPIGETTRLLFLASPQGSNVILILDGRKVDLSLNGPQSDQRIALMTTQYKQGIPAGLINSVVVLADLIAFAFLLLLAWLIQEIPQLDSPKAGRQTPERLPGHRTLLITLLLPSLILHLISFLTVPLVVGPDSISYIGGAIHWLEYHDLSGASSYRGPGISFLLLPGMLLFGRNPWGIKIIFHLLAIGCVPLAYRLGWQLSRRRWIAFFAGLMTVFIPDLFSYSNFVMSEMPNVFFGLAYVSLLLSALETLSFGWILAALLMGSFSTLVRPENLIYLVMGVVFLLAHAIWQWMQTKNVVELKKRIFQLALSLLLALAPILGWSFHNLNRYGFFGLTNYTGAALYDGWIYFGERSNIAIIAKYSPSVRLIQSYFPSELEDPRRSPTSWGIFEAMKQDGYTDLQIFSILNQATVDSVKTNTNAAIQLFFVKIREGFTPEFVPTETFLLPGEDPGVPFLNRAEAIEYFEPEIQLSSPALIQIQRAAFRLAEGWFTYYYWPLTWFCIAVALLCLYRKPFFIWFPFVALTLGRVFAPTILGLSHWRYIVSGIISLLVFLPIAIQSLMDFVAFILTPSVHSKGSEDPKLEFAGYD